MSSPPEWPTATLSECCEIVSGSTPRRDRPEYWGGDINWATPRDLSRLDRPVLEMTEERITRAGLQSCSTTLLPEGAVLFSSRAPVGLVAIAGQPMCTNQGFKSLIPGPKVDSGYLYWFLKHAGKSIEHSGNGTTFTEVSKAAMERVRIPLPPLPEQRRIADLLDRADAIRCNREESRRLVDELLRSVFLGMFGDPVRNEKGWEAVPLEAIADIASGVTIGRRLDPTGDRREVPYLRVANVQDGFFSLSEIKTTIATHEEVERYALRANDILLTEGGDPDKLGRGAVWDGGIEPCIHQNHVFRVRLRERGWTAEYLNALLGSAYGKRYFFKAAKQTTGIASINRTQLGRFPVLIAPSDLQERFALAKRGIDNLSAQVDRSCEEIVDLRSGISGLLLDT